MDTALTSLLHVGLGAMVWLTALTLAASGLRAWSGLLVQVVDGQARVPWTRDRIAALARETVFRTAFALARPFGRPGPIPRAGRPVLLVADAAWGPASLAPLAAALRRRGWAPWIPAALPMQASLADRADRLCADLQALCAATGTPHADVVAFGHGGLVAAWAARHRTPPIGRLVTLGCPWRGTKLAVLWPAPLHADARPDALVLDDLLPPRVPTASVYAPDDPEIVPADAAIADTQRAVAVDGCGHLGLLLSARSFRAVHIALADPLPAASADAEPAPATTLGGVSAT